MADILSKNEQGVVVLSQEAKTLTADIKNFQILKAQMDIREKELKKALLKAMTDNNIKVFENSDIKITRKDSYIRKGVDTQKLKDEGLYDSFLKETEVSPSIVLEFKDDDDVQ